MEIQLREYRIEPGQMDEWIARWRAGVVPLREEAGFQVMGAWTDRASDRFVWVLGYDGDDGFDAANERYYASPSRAALSPEPSDLIVVAIKTMVEGVL